MHAMPMSKIPRYPGDIINHKAVKCRYRDIPVHFNQRPGLTDKSPLPLTDPRDAVPRAHLAVHRCRRTQCDKLVTDDGHQFTTLTIRLS